MTRRNAVSVLGGACLFVAGFAAGVLVGPCSEPPRGVSESVPAVRTSPSVETRPPAPTAPASPSTAAPEPGLTEFQVAIHSLPPPEVPKGEGTITGSVASEDGRPLAGVTVTLMPEEPATLPDGKDLELARRAIRSVQAIRWREAARRTTATDAAGLFRFDGVADMRHRVSTSFTPGWRISPKDSGAAERARPGDRVEFVAEATTEVRIEAVLPDGTVPPAIQGLIVRPSSSESGTWTLDRGVFRARLRPGPAQVSITAGEGDEYFADPQSVDIPEGREVLTLRFALRGRPGIRGTLTFEDGAPWGNLGVHLARLSGEQKPTADLFRTGSVSSVHNSGVESLPFRFPDLVPGRYALGACLGNPERIVFVEELVIGDAPQVHDLRVPRLESADAVVVRVFNPEGKAVRDVRFGAEILLADTTVGGTPACFPQPDGSFRVMLPMTLRKEDADAPVRLTASTDGYGWRSTEVRRGTQEAVEIRFEESGVVEARLGGFRESRFRDRLAFWFGTSAETDFGGGLGPARPDSEGRQILPAVQPGEFVLFLLLQYDNGATQPLLRLPLSVRAGRNEVIVAMPGLHRVMVTGAAEGVSFRRPDYKWWSLYFPAKEDGSVIVDGLPDGEYEVWCGRKKQALTLPGTTEIRF